MPSILTKSQVIWLNKAQSKEGRNPHQLAIEKESDELPWTRAVERPAARVEWAAEVEY